MFVFKGWEKKINFTSVTPVRQGCAKFLGHGEGTFCREQKEIKEDKDSILKITILSCSPSEENRVILREQAVEQSPND